MIYQINSKQIKFQLLYYKQFYPLLSNKLIYINSIEDKSPSIKPSFSQPKNMLYSQPLQSIKDLPRKDKDRNCTDIVCTIVGVLFGVGMFVMAFVLMKKDNYYKANFPTDSSNVPCGYGQNAKHPMVYFPDVNDKNTRVCVSVCPSAGDKQLICRTNSKVPSCKTTIYQTTQDFQRLGGFCAPVDQALRQKLIQNANLTEKWTFLNTYDTIRLSLLIALGIGFLWWVLVQLIPFAMSAVAIFLSVLVAIGIGILLIVDNSRGYEGKELCKLIVGVVMLLIAAFIVAFILLFKRRIKLMGLFLAWSTQWAKENLKFILWIPIFIISTVGLIVLIFFQHLAFISQNDPQPQQNDIYLKLKPVFIWQLLNIIEFIWGLQFLKDSFNFIISGSATQWYLQEQENGLCLTFTRMIKYHFGSIVGGSFLNAFFNLIDFVFQSLRCYPDGRCNKMAPCCNIIFETFLGTLCNLVRTDVYSYINMAGIPYCNACRNCEVINRKSNEFVGSQSIEFFYRGCSYISCVGICFLICYFIEKSKINAINVDSLIVIILLTYCVLAYFIDFHANAAEGIHVTSVLERDFGKQQNPRTHENWKKQLQKLLKNQPGDGTF